jgi:two-component system phosphate regulon sensor histidine kinase PhoR
VFEAWESVAAAVPVARDVGAASSTSLPVSAGGREFWLSFVAVESGEGVVYAFRDLTGERRLDEEKRDFVATFSHELRTPMTGVYGAAQTLLRTDIDWDASQHRQLLQLFATQAERLSQIVDDLLLATSIDHDRVQISQESVDIGELVRRTLEVLDALAVEVDIPDQAHVLGDRDRIQQILVNLLDNAFKYGRPPVRVIVAPTNGALEVVVRDAGTGIPREEEERIFEKFYRSDPELARAPSGTGLGLYIARALAERMGGMLDVRSAAGGGTEFVLTLPRP